MSGASMEYRHRRTRDTLVVYAADWLGRFSPFTARKLNAPPPSYFVSATCRDAILAELLCFDF